MDQGKIIQKGTHTSLAAEKGIYQEIFNIQTQIEVELEKEITNAG
jgi:ATP-binding cassette subfamily B protein